MELQIVKTAGNSQLENFFLTWLSPLPELLIRYRQFSDEFVEEGNLNPLRETEQCAVGLLASAATLVGFLPLIEYHVEKASRHGGKVNKFCRADLWIFDGTDSYSLEFKGSNDPNTARDAQHWLSEAVNEVARVGPDESEFKFGGVIAPVHDGVLPNISGGHDDIDYIFCLTESKKPDVYLMFRMLKD